MPSRSAAAAPSRTVTVVGHRRHLVIMEEEEPTADGREAVLHGKDTSQGADVTSS